MRMDRYEEDNIDISKKSRTDKNQELYTDVYLNNAYVDISEINEVVNDKVEEFDIKKKIEKEPISYTYQEKNYDINELISQAIENDNDNLKRSLEHTTEIENIIKSINESQAEKEKDENLLSDLLADSDTTTVVTPLDNLIVDTNEVDTSVIHKDEMSNEMLEEIEKEDNLSSTVETKEDNKSDNQEVSDNSLVSETKTSKKKIFIIIGIVLIIIAILVGILIYKKIIKF